MLSINLGYIYIAHNHGLNNNNLQKTKKGPAAVCMSINVCMYTWSVVAISQLRKLPQSHKQHGLMSNNKRQVRKCR